MIEAKESAIIPARGAPNAPAGAFDRGVAFLRRRGRLLLLILGLFAIGALVANAGPEKVWGTIVTCGPWLPLVIFGEAAWMAMDTVALFVIYRARARRIPLGELVRAMLTHFTVMIVLPAGRAGAEVARAAMLAPYVGGPRAAAAAVQLQSAVMLGNTLVSLLCLAAIVSVAGPIGLLQGLLALNIFGTAVFGTGIHLVTRRVRIGGWLGRRFAKMANAGPELDEAFRDSPRIPWAPVGIALVGRLIQALEIGVILMAVGGIFSITGAFSAQGIVLVGTGFGDVIPGQAGALEGAYRLFAGVLGFGDAPEKALSLALVGRIAVLCVAAIYFGILKLWPAPAARGTHRAPGDRREVGCHKKNHENR